MFRKGVDKLDVGNALTVGVFSVINNTCSGAFNIASSASNSSIVQDVFSIALQASMSGGLGSIFGRGATSGAYGSLLGIAILGNFALQRQIKRNEGEGPKQFHPKTVAVLLTVGTVAATIVPVALASTRETVPIFKAFFTKTCRIN